MQYIISWLNKQVFDGVTATQAAAQVSDDDDISDPEEEICRRMEIMREESDDEVVAAAIPLVPGTSISNAGAVPSVDPPVFVAPAPASAPTSARTSSRASSAVPPTAARNGATPESGSAAPDAPSKASRPSGRLSDRIVSAPRIPTNVESASRAAPESVHGSESESAQEENFVSQLEQLELDDELSEPEIEQPVAQTKPTKGKAANKKAITPAAEATGNVNMAPAPAPKPKPARRSTRKDKRSDDIAEVPVRETRRTRTAAARK